MIPVRGKVLVEPIIRKSEHGFVETEETTFEKARVIAVSEPIELTDDLIKVGDIVYYKSYAPSVIDISEDESYTILALSDIEGYDSLS